MPNTRSTRALRTTATVQTVAKAEDVVEGEAGPSRRPRKRVKVEKEEVVYAEAVEEIMEDALPEPKPAKKARKKRTMKAETSAVSIEETADTQRLESKKTKAKPRAKPKPKAQEYDPSTFLPRVKSPWKVGAHVSASGGVENAVVNAAMIGANAFALFLKSQRKWSSPPLSVSSAALFKERMKELDYDPKHVLPHGSYLINLGNPDEEKRKKSYECFMDDLRRCEALGLKYYNFHPGSSVGQTSRLESIAHIAECLNDAHREVEGVVTVLENMAGAGNVIGSTFEDIAGIIERVEDKTRVGVCFDTCHAYASGYDISTPEGWEKTMKEFDDVIGIKYLCGMHLNDSKTPCGSRKDRHESVGLGTLGLPAFYSILTDPRMWDIALILETPSYEKPVEVWGVEVGVLNALSGIPREGSSTTKVDGVANASLGGGGKEDREERDESPLTEPEDDEEAVPKREKTMDDLLEEIRCAVSKASLEADAKKAKSKARAVGNGKTKRKRKAAEEDDGDEGEEDELEGE